MCSLKIFISESILEKLDDIVKQNLPFEACAVLVGKKIDNSYRVNMVIPLDSQDKSQVRFSINEDQLFDIYRKIEIMQLSVVGIFHSHPSPPLPSKTDITFMEINPVPWIIKSTTTNEIRCYIHDENYGIKEVEIHKAMD